MRRLRSPRVALATGLVLTAAAIGTVLAGAPITVAGSNGVPLEQVLGYSRGGPIGCVKAGTLPPGTSALRLPVGANVGPRVSVSVFAGPRLVAHGVRAAGWGISETVTVPIKPLPRAIPEVRVCVAIGRATEAVEVKGAVVRKLTPGGRIVGYAERFRVEYLRAGPSSWWSLISSVAHRMGLGHAASGTWVVFLELALMIAVAALSSWLILGALEGRRPTWLTGPRAEAVEGGSRLRRVLRLPGRIPRAAWVCGLIAALNAVCWSLITPPFQVPDETSHFAYVQWLAETGSLPTNARTDFSEEEQIALRDLHQNEVRFYPEREPIPAQADQRRLEADLALPLARTGGGGANVAASQPPVYYALQTIPYFIGSGGTLLDRLAVMRLLSALMAAFTALFAYLFVREALPGAPWAWVVGGVGVALAPLLGFMSGGVNPDSMFFAVAAALFFCLARAFRRGLTPRRAIAIGALIALGSFTKLNFVGLVPGALLGLLVLGLRARRTSKRTAYRSLALGLAIAAAPAFLYVVINLARGHPALGSVSQLEHPAGSRGTLLGEINYIWQFYLPRLPLTRLDFPGLIPLRAIWFDRSIGFYGWLDTSFPSWVYVVAVIPCVLIAVLVIRKLVVRRTSLRHRLSELAVYAVMAVGLMVLTGAASYLEFPTQAGRYGEPRYLLPLIPLFALAIALGARGAGRRWGRTVAALIVVLILAWDIFSQLQVIARYYG
jgi:hypothetical protein